MIYLEDLVTMSRYQAIRLIPISVSVFIIFVINSDPFNLIKNRSTDTDSFVPDPETYS